MPVQIEQSVIDSLVARPAEALNVEIKRWIDPDSSAGIEKVIKATLALRNRNGGYLVIGFDDNSLLPDSGHEPADVRGTFHVDKIQGLVSRYASELFEIAVAFSKRNGVDHPIIVVPPGVRVPVAAKRDLNDSGKTLVRNGAVYFRTLASNGTPSTAEARPEDWRELVEICFAVRERTLDIDAQRLVKAGSWSVGLVIDPPKIDARPDRTFQVIIASSNPNLTGWPIWLDSSLSSAAQNRPIVRENGLEALILFHGVSSHLDFHRFDPKGEFYLRRALQDDAVPSKVDPGTTLDPILMVSRVAETIVVGITLAISLGWSVEETRLGFAFRWNGLKGRRLSQWSDPYGGIDWGEAYDDQITTYTEMPLDTPISAVAPFVDQATKDLFVLFSGHTLTPGVIEDRVQRLIERRLNA